jgi:hypothetical protein
MPHVSIIYLYKNSWIFFNITYNIRLIFDPKKKKKVAITITYGFYYCNCMPNVFFNIWENQIQVALDMFHGIFGCPLIQEILSI